MKALKKSAALLTILVIAVMMQLQAYAYDKAISKREIRMIEAVVMHEVGYCSRESMIAVTHVILNRVESPLFPDTVEEVLHQKGQFTAIHNYYDCEFPVSYRVHKAVREAMRIKDTTGGALFFYAPRYLPADSPAMRWFQSLETTLVLEGVSYCR